MASDPGVGVNPADPAIAARAHLSTPIPNQDRRGVARFWNGATRALVVVFGGLLVLQSSDRLDAPKLVYLVVAGIATAGSVASVWRARNEPTTMAMRPWLVASVVIVALVALSFPVGLSQGSTIGNWVRDAAAYGLLAAAPWLAVDLARAGPARLILSAGLVAGLLGVASFVVVWVQRRQLLDLPIDRLALPSMTLGAAAYCIALACAVRSGGWKRVGWTLLSMAVVAAFLLTGTRTAFVLLAGPAMVLLLEWRRHGLLGLRAGAIPVVAQVAAVAMVLAISLSGFSFAPASSAQPSIPPNGQPSGSGGPTASGGTPGGSGEPATSGPPAASGPAATPAGQDLEDRFSSLDGVTSGRDQSLRLRIEATRVAFQAFLGSPLLGTGLGHEFSYMETSTREYRSLTIDTPVIVLAKFGVLGLLMSGVLAAALVLVIRGTIRRSGTTWAALSLVAYGAILLVLIPFGWPPEDKGTAYALVFLLALGVIDRTPSAETAV